MIRLSPHADQVAACLDTTVSSDVVLGPVTGTQHALRGQLLAQPPSHTLSPPGRALAEMVWSHAGQHLVLLSHDGDEDYADSMHVSIYKGTRQVSSFLEPLTDSEGLLQLLIFDDPAIVFLFLGSWLGTRAVVSTAQGAMTARHPRAQLAASMEALEGGRVLTASECGDRLCIYSATGMQELSLQPAGHQHVRLGSWGPLAAVVHSGCPEGVENKLLLIDLDHQVVLHRIQLPQLSGSLAVCSAVMGARSVALRLDGGYCVLASTPREAGAELFRCPGCEAQWDSLGKFLAIRTDDGGLRVLDGATGTEVASWRATPIAGVAQSWRWLAESRGLSVFRGGGLRGPHDWNIVRFVGGV